MADSRTRVASTMRWSPPHMARSRRAARSGSTSSPRTASFACDWSRSHTVVVITSAIAHRARCVTPKGRQRWGIDAGLTYKSAQGRWVIIATVLGSGMAFLDSTVVNIALPRIGEDLGIGLSGLQWTVNAYTLTLSGFLLLGGSLGDRYGRRKVFVIGVVWFAVASLLCAVSPTGGFLVGARAIQGVGAALLTPGSLAIIEASFRPEDRSAAIGAWSGLGGVATALGPFLGGWLVDAASWRW